MKLVEVAPEAYYEIKEQLSELTELAEKLNTTIAQVNERLAEMHSRAPAPVEWDRIFDVGYGI